MKLTLQDKAIYTNKGKAFVDFGNNELLCIGTAEEAEKADLDTICDMICEALALYRFRAIRRGRVVH